MVGAERFELSTSCTPSKRASQATLRPDRVAHPKTSGAEYRGALPALQQSISRKASRSPATAQILFAGLNKCRESLPSGANEIVFGFCSLVCDGGGAHQGTGHGREWNLLAADRRPPRF